MAEKFIDILMNINNVEIRQALEAMFAICGVTKNSTTDTGVAINVTGDVTGNLTGNVTGDVIGDVTGDLTGDVTGDLTGSATELVAGTAPVNAVKATTVLTSSGALVPATHAVSVLTSDTTNVSEDETVTINTTVYTFKVDPTGIAYAVDIGANAAGSLANLAAAINASGTPDTEYGTGTAAHPEVVCTANDATTLTIQAKEPGTTPNAYATTETSAHLSWADTTLGGGTGASVAGVTTAGAQFTIDDRTYTIVDELSETNADAIVDQILYGGNEAACLDNIKVAINNGATEGTNYSTGTVVHASVTATYNTNTTQKFVAKTAGVAGNAIATTETLANTAFTDTVMAGGVDGTVGTAGQVILADDLLYVTLSDNTIADNNWRAVPLASFVNDIGTQTFDEVIALGDTDFESDVIFLDGSVACTITEWTPTVGRTYILECTDSTADPSVTLTSGITINPAGNDKMTFPDAGDIMVLKCVSATRMVILNNYGSVTLATA